MDANIQQIEYKKQDMMEKFPWQLIWIASFLAMTGGFKGDDEEQYITFSLLL